MDFVVITASTPTQADSYRALVQSRIEAGDYPRSIAFRFYCDPPGGRVGSGGGTLLALAALLEEEAPSGDAADAATAAAFFGSKRTLLVHAGGESRRLPCYVPEGKLFAPLLLQGGGSGAPPTVLDFLLTLYSGYPWCEPATSRPPNV